MILQKTIDSVFNTADIVEVIGDFIQLKKSGSNYRGLSCFNSEKTPSLMVSPAKQIFKCFSSGKGGNAVNFLMLSQHWTYPEAIHYLCNKYGIEYLETEKSDEEKKIALEKEALYVINDAAADFFAQNYELSNEAKSYFEQRKLSIDTLSKFKVGFAPGTITALTSHLLNKGFSWQLGTQASLISYRDNKIYDRFVNRLVFPITDVYGKISGFGGRALNWNKESKYPKYLNSSDSLVYSKSELLYGLYQAKNSIVKNDVCLLCEGYTDVLGFNEAGIDNIVAASGTGFSEAQARLIARFTSNLILLYDGDSAGIKASLRSVDIALSMGLVLKICILPNGQDPDTFRIEKTKDEILDYININSKDFILFKLEYLLKSKSDISNKGSVITEIIDSIAKVKNNIQREIYLRECARVTEVNIDALRIMLNETINTDKDFIEIPEEILQEQEDPFQYLMYQCESRIIQYLFTYHNIECSFKEVYLQQNDFGFEEVVEYKNNTVLQKIKNEIINDDIQFSDIRLNVILYSIIGNDLNTDWKSFLSEELYLLVTQLYEQEKATDLNSFASDGQANYNYTIPDKKEVISKSLTETIIHYKIMYVEKMIKEKSKQVDVEYNELFELIDFNTGLKQKMNLL